MNVLNVGNKNKILILSLILALLSLELYVGSAAAQNEDESQRSTSSVTSDFVMPSLSALHVNWHEPSGRELMSSSIEVSGSGLRVREHGSGSSHEMLQNFKEKKSWLIDHKRSISHLLQFVEIPDFEELSTPGSRASFLSPKPCGLLRAINQGSGVWRGRRVVAFHCLGDINELLSIEFIDTIYQIVVYRRSVDGYVDELRGLTNRSFDPSHFTPPVDYRYVGKDEFFFGAPALLQYSDSNVK